MLLSDKFRAPEMGLVNMGKPNPYMKADFVPLPIDRWTPANDQFPKNIPELKRTDKKFDLGDFFEDILDKGKDAINDKLGEINLPKPEVETEVKLSTEVYLAIAAIIAVILFKQ